ncbi:DNA gyrase subunit A [Globicatella sanguinis]|uniref:DNA gyrase subunit A n=1 Tax=Globicatella sanguinis TaxID=13076 RepID=UPI002542882B|nr:DNA gyrase subunit A [Globicatella sanguinis]MDK7631060.1 DNA gyrase subunit A [Globicatella sanguinis]WIK65467.1 DNA gyrase subunit A [Globicatella sanguinis]WKT54872.1 DNA gyrase subunit A [Globicatella sanguinis]
MSELFDQKRDFETINLPDEMRNSFLDYAMSVIVARAVPDVRDGLKPVHRRILYGMNELGVTPDKPYKKSARIVGDVMGKYHPHGDFAIYEAMVRMAQPFSYRQMLVDGHGNFGSVDGDGAAAMRYTEARMSKIALEMLKDINKDTIDFQENYSQEEKEPVVLPARFPNLLVNGTSGIAVGMATNIPPHNLGEVIDALNLLMRNPEVTVNELMEVLPGPDFPTGAIVMGKSGIRKAYETGKGKIIIRSRVEIEQLSSDRERIVVTEIPYGVNKAKVVERIAELAREKRIEGITYVADESGREGMRIVIDVRRDTSANVVLNNLYKYTALQVSFGFNMLAIDKGVPKVLSLKEILEKYLDHQVEVIRRRTAFEKRKAEDRAHILEGLRIALDVIDEVIAIIRGSREAEIAKNTLIERFNLTPIQAQAILDMRLVRLTGLEREKIDKEYDDLIALIQDLTDILANETRVLEIIEDELADIKLRFDDERRTELRVGELTNIDDEDLIEEEDVLIALTTNGYIKRMTQDEFQVQNRGGRGVKGMGLTDDDEIQSLISCSTHDTLLFFTNLGKVYRTKGYDIPEYGRTAKGLPIVNLINIEKDEYVKEMIKVRSEGKETDKYLFFVTKQGVVKRSDANEFTSIRNNGLRAINMREEDELIKVLVTNGGENIIIGTHNANAMAFNEEDVRVMGRTATGVRGVKLREGDYVVGAALLKPDSEVLVVTEKGYGKRTAATEYSIKNRGGLGVKTSNISEKSGKLAGIVTIDNPEAEDLMLMTDQGVIIRFNVDSISQTSRATLGVKMIRVDDNAIVSSITKIIKTDDEAEDVATLESANDEGMEENDDIIAGNDSELEE